MECIGAALKDSLVPEMAVKRAQQQASLDDLWAVNGQTGVSGDDFFVDDLLDFSNGGVEDGFFEAGEEPEKSVAVSPQEQQQREKEDKDSGTSLCVINDSSSFPCSELSVPADDLADLEWLSHFVEDSFSQYSLSYPAGKSPENPAEDRIKPPQTPAPTVQCFATPVQTKARSKRARTGGRVWSLGSPPLTQTESSSSSTSSSTSSSPSTPWLICTSPSQTADSLLRREPANKKKRKKQETSGGGGPPQPRRCSHCLVQKTPQWRAGPLGAKTLCNACGVRFKSGRLLPEYRPACSPTFSSEIHSNNHRKVLEMRRKKEMEGGLTPSPPPVRSF